MDIGATVGRPLGALVVEQPPLTSSIASPTPVLELHLQALGGSVEVRSFLFNHTGGGTILTPALPFEVTAGQLPRVVQITLDPSGSAPKLDFLLDASAYRAQAHKNKYGREYPPISKDVDRY